MRRWDRLLDSYVEEYRARGVSPQSVAYTEARLNRWGRWLKRRRPRIGIERIDAEMITHYMSNCSSFRAKATVYATLSTMRGFGDYLVRQGLWKINPQYLRDVRGNGASAVNRAVVVLRRFYGAMVAMGYLDHAANPLVGFPSIKAVPRKLPVALSSEQVRRLLAEPEADTIIGLRDGAMLALLYGTGIRASECASLRSGQVDLAQLTITVQGKGGHERVIPLNPQLAEVLRTYVQARGPALPTAPFFRSRFGRLLSRGSVYERVRTWGQRSRIGFPLSPHRMRHTFATHLVRAGVGLVTIRDLLGHRLITSTQIYLHVTVDDLRAAAARHPISSLLNTVKHLLATGPLPFQRPHPMYDSG